MLVVGILILAVLDFLIDVWIIRTESGGAFMNMFINGSWLALQMTLLGMSGHVTMAGIAFIAWLVILLTIGSHN